MQGKLKAAGVDVAARVKSTLVADVLTVNGSTSTNVVRPLFGLCASYKLNQNVDLRADFDHVSGLGKTATGKMNDNMVSLGVGYNF